MTINKFIPFATPIFTWQQNVKCYQELKDMALQLEEENKGRNVSNAGGYQSQMMDTENINILNFYQEIYPVVQKYIAMFELSYLYHIKLDSLWFNVNRKCNYNHTHSHPGSDISGVYYLNVPENSGKIVFVNPDTTVRHLPFYEGPFDNYNQFNSSRFHFDLADGLLILFPSHLDHYVEMNNSEKPRLSIAFNIKTRRS